MADWSTPPHIPTPPHLNGPPPLPLRLCHLARRRPTTSLLRRLLPYSPQFRDLRHQLGFLSLETHCLFSATAASRSFLMDHQIGSGQRGPNASSPPARSIPIQTLAACSFFDIRVFSFFDIRVRELGDEYALQYINFRPTANSIGEAGNLYMEKVAVLNSGGGRFVLLTIHVSGKLVVYKSGDEKWRLIDDLPSPYDDVILWGGRFYAVDNTGRIVRVNIEDLNVSIVANSIFGGDKKFLVDRDGELLLVDMYLSVEPADDLRFEGPEFYEEFDSFMSERTVKFKVFRLDGDAEKWIEMTDLGDKMLFLGDNCTFLASAAETFGDEKCKGNCILFTDQYCNRQDDGGWLKARGVGVFDLEIGIIGPIDSHTGYSKMFWPPPDWVIRLHQ